jgi:oxygen-dependent protoporphyrinogen oxidase
MLTTFLGGVRRGNALDSTSDNDVRETVMKQLGTILNITGEPELFHIKRWKRAIPQYRVGYEEVLAKCERFEQENRGIFFCSNFYRGISVGDCIKNAFSTAERVEESLK